MRERSKNSLGHRLSERSKRQGVRPAVVDLRRQVSKGNDVPSHARPNRVTWASYRASGSVKVKLAPPEDDLAQIFPPWASMIPEAM